MSRSAEEPEEKKENQTSALPELAFLKLHAELPDLNSTNINSSSVTERHNIGFGDGVYFELLKICMCLHCLWGQLSSAWGLREAEISKM